jgi:hypothetical protein
MTSGFLWSDMVSYTLGGTDGLCHRKVLFDDERIVLNE